VTARILVVDDEAGLREMLAMLLARAGYHVSTANGFVQAADSVDELPTFDLVITDLAMPDGSGMDVLNKVKKRDSSTEVIVVTAYATTENAVQAMRDGAYDYIEKPFKNDALLAVVEKALEKRAIVHENLALRERMQKGFRAGNLIGKSAAMQRVMDMVRRVASAPASVLITGDSGTGKELVARAIHGEGERAAGPFVAINCAAMPESLLESELFGHEKGAFTGATAAKEGLFRAAHQGTLFLDEVGELPLALQVKLLRVLQERTVRSVGGEKEYPVDVRMVAATNRDIEAEVAAGKFRQDLFYRLNVIRLHLPPLRERPEDVPLLADHFLRKHSALQQKRLRFSPDALRWISNQPFPGNVRELENLVERAVTLANGSIIEMADLPGEEPASQGRPTDPSALLSPGQAFDLDAYLGEVEKRLLLAALEKAGGVRKRAAKLIGMTFRSLRYRLAKYGLDKEEEEEQDESDNETE
jgi:two-component system response regulator PilR (NtrC family)